MTKRAISIVLVLALMAVAGAGCKAGDPGAGQGGKEGTDEVSAELVDPSEVPEDILNKLMEGAPENASAKSACVRLWLSKTAYMCCSWAGGMSCQRLKK